jgi:hypothetical protein
MTAAQLIKHYGGTKQAADAIGVTSQSIRNWLKRGIPKQWQAWIALDTGGALKASKK